MQGIILQKGQGTITAVKLSQDHVFIGTDSGVLTVISRGNMCSKTYNFNDKQPITSIDMLDDIILVGTLGGIYQVDVINDRYQKILKQLSKVSKIQLLQDKLLLVSCAQQDLKYPILSNETIYQYQQPFPTYKIYLCNLKKLPLATIISYTSQHASSGLFVFNNESNKLVIPLNVECEQLLFAIYKLETKIRTNFNSKFQTKYYALTSQYIQQNNLLQQYQQIKIQQALNDCYQNYLQQLEYISDDKIIINYCNFSLKISPYQVEKNDFKTFTPSQQQVKMQLKYDGRDIVLNNKIYQLECELDGLDFDENNIVIVQNDAVAYIMI